MKQERADSNDSMKSSESDENQSELFKLFFKEYSITSEYDLFVRQNLPGAYCVPKAENPSEWFGILFLRQGPYQGAILRFILGIPANFPQEGPTLKFEIPLFHPLINATQGTLNCSPAYANINVGDRHVYHALVYVQQIFFKVETANAVHTEAALLFESNPEKFQEKVTESIRRSREIVYDIQPTFDSHTVKFTPWDQTIHEPIRAQILKRPSDTERKSTNKNSMEFSHGNAQHSGLSFFQAKSLKPMANESSRVYKQT